MPDAAGQVARLAWRSLLLLAAAGLVVAAMRMLLGAPSASRLYRHSEIARFTPTAGHGVVQLLGETMIIALFAWLGRRWLRVRL